MRVVSARHKTIENAMVYKRDAQYMLEIAIHNNRPLIGTKSKFKPIFIENLQQARSINRNNGSYSLYQFCHRYMKDLVRVGEIQQPASSLSMIEKAIAYKRQGSSHETIKKFAREHLKDLAFTDELLSFVEQQARIMFSEYNLTSSTNPSSQETSPPTSATGTRRNSADPLGQPPPKKARGGILEIEGKESLRNIKDGMTKLNAMIEMVKSGPQHTNQMTETSRNFHNKSLLPVMRCAADHCGGEKDVFLKRWGSGELLFFSHANFSTKKCPGTGPKCRGEVAEEREVSVME